MACLVVFLHRVGFHLSPNLEVREQEAPSTEAKQFLAAMEGTIIIKSMHSRTFGIYQLNPQTLTPGVIIDTTRHEEESDSSPDGSFILYTAGQPDNELARPQVWIARSNGSQHRKLINSGCFPTFPNDGQSVHCLFEGKKVMTFSLLSEESVEIFPKKRKRFRTRQLKHPRD